MKYSADITCLTPGPGQYFFGYYDICPWDYDNRGLLALKTTFLDRIPDCQDQAEIILVTPGTPDRILGATTAWNWQLGARLQWLPSSSGRRIIYNISAAGKLQSEILDLETDRTRRLALPVFSLTPDGKDALTLDFQILREKRLSYGYDGEFGAPGSGILRMSIETGTIDQIISLRQLREFRPVTSLKAGQDWVNHILIAPEGRRFCFLHRWQLPGGGVYSRLFSANIDGSALTCLHDSGLVTHCGWRSKNELAGWARKEGGMTTLKKNRAAISLVRGLLPLYRCFFSRFRQLHRMVSRDGYLLWRDPEGLRGEIGMGQFPGDGHCSFSPDQKFMLTDTYPHPNHRRSLLLYDLENDEISQLAKVASLPAPEHGLDRDWDLSGSRCDLHPRWDRTGERICFDSVHEGDRKFYQARLKPEK